MRRTWEVMLVVNRNCTRELLDTPVRYMPAWLIGSPTNSELAKALRIASPGSSGSDITTFNDLNPDQVLNPTVLLDLIELHHPYMTRLNIAGSEDSISLQTSMRTFDFVPAKSMWPETIAYRRPIPADVPVSTLHLEASTWKTTDDVYGALLAAIGAPAWHGRNFNALNDSVVTGDINTIEVPYKLVICDFDLAAPEAQAFTNELASLFREFEDLGCPVSMEISG